MPTILRQIDALAINKMSVLHWHAVDSDSFSLAMDSFPGLASKAAYSPRGKFDLDLLTCASSSLIVLCYYLPLDQVYTPSLSRSKS